MKTLFYSALSVGVLTAGLLSYLSVANADNSSYYLDPPRAEVIVNPKTNLASGAITVTSSSNSLIKLKVIPKLWGLDKDGAIEYLEEPTTGFNLLKSVRFNPLEFELKPKTTRLLRYVVNIPKDVKDGEYPLQVYFEPSEVLKPAEDSASTKGIKQVLKVVPVFTTTMYIYKGKVAPQVKMDSFTCGYDKAKSAVSVNLSVSNAGNKHARLFANAVLSQLDANGKATVLETYHLRQNTLFIVFPDHTRQHSELLTSAVKPVKPLLTGKYRMDLQLVDERELQPAVPAVCEFSL